MPHKAECPPYWPSDVEFLQTPDFSLLSAQARRTMARSGPIPGLQFQSLCGYSFETNNFLRAKVCFLLCHLALLAVKDTFCVRSKDCLSCGRVIATRDWPAFEVIGELCGRFLLPPLHPPRRDSAHQHVPSPILI
jgi:hypothetical protein